MSEQKAPRISGLEAAQWQPGTAKLIQDLVQQVFEENTGKPHEWRHMINADAIELVPVPEKPAEPKPLARVDVFDGHVMAQYLPGQRDRLLRELLVLVNNLTLSAPAPFMQAVEVEAVKE